MKPSLAICAALALLVSSCQLAGSNMHNLDELHWTDGRHKRTGHIWNDYEYAMHVGIRGFLKGIGSTAQDQPPVKIDKPLQLCVENLNELVSYDASDPWIAARQVEYCARIAVDDPWHISREIAVHELGKHGERLHMRDHQPRKLEGELAGVDAVRDALQRLVQASGPVLRNQADPAETAAFAAACDAVRALRLDREGALRLLRSTAILEHARAASARLAPLHELCLDLQRTCLELALNSALHDEPPGERTGSDPGWHNELVQAAAIEACVRAFGPAMFGRLMVDFSPRDREPERLLAYLRLVRKYGLPAAPTELSEADRAAAPEKWTKDIYTVATDHPEGRVRLAAMAALGKLSGREPFSVREEDWQEWWLARKSDSAGSNAH